MGRLTFLKNEGSAHDPKHKLICEKQFRECCGIRLAWLLGWAHECYLTDKWLLGWFMTHGSSKSILWESRHLISFQRKALTTFNERSFIIWKNNDPKHFAETTNRFIREISGMFTLASRSLDWKSFVGAFCLLPRRQKEVTPKTNNNWKSCGKESPQIIAVNAGWLSTVALRQNKMSFRQFKMFQIYSNTFVHQTCGVSLQLAYQIQLWQPENKSFILPTDMTLCKLSK